MKKPKKDQTGKFDVNIPGVSLLFTGKLDLRKGMDYRPASAFKLKKPVKIEYASAEQVANVTKEVIREHAHTIAILAKT